LQQTRSSRSSSSNIWEGVKQQGCLCMWQERDAPALVCLHRISPCHISCCCCCCCCCCVQHASYHIMTIATAAHAQAHMHPWGCV
jgi:hypothetical protein